MKCFFVHAALFIFALYFESTNADSGGGECPEIEPVGCFKDRPKHRTLGRLMITDRDKKSAKYMRINIDWGNYKEYVEYLACRCARKAKESGYSFFGLQYYGECWSGPDAEEGHGYDKWGESKRCVNEYYGKCEDPEEESCIGKSRANFVYKLKESGSGDQMLE